MYVEDNQISNFGCPLTTNFRTEFCYPDIVEDYVLEFQVDHIYRMYSTEHTTEFY